MLNSAHVELGHIALLLVLSHLVLHTMPARPRRPTHSMSRYPSLQERAGFAEALKILDSLARNIFEQNPSFCWLNLDEVGRMFSREESVWLVIWCRWRLLVFAKESRLKAALAWTYNFTISTAGSPSLCPSVHSDCFVKTVIDSPEFLGWVESNPTYN